MTTAWQPCSPGSSARSIGSFLNVVAYRLPRGEALVAAAVALPATAGRRSALRQHPGALVAAAARPLPALQGADLPPLPGGGGATALLCALVVVVGPGAEAVSGSSLVLLLVPVTLIDLDHHIIPNKLMAIRGGASRWRSWPSSTPTRSSSISSRPRRAGGFLFVAAVVYPAGMGMGDVKLAPCSGMFLGRAVAPAMFVAMHRRRPRRRADHRAQGRRGGPQGRHPVRPLPRLRRPRGRARRRRDGRLVPRTFL